MVTNSHELLGQALGTCTLQRLIGQGGMGVVYLAQQSRPKRTVAVKVLLPRAFLAQIPREDFLARFRREADAVAALDHINIMPIYEYGEQEDIAYLVMPHVTGGTLRQVLEQRGKLPMNETLSIIEQAASALDCAHAQGIIHRDLKPGNILFHADGRVLLTDFGLAKMIKDDEESESHMHTLTRAGTIVGTAEYLSPEQGGGKPVDYRTDVYSLGIILFQMLAGRVPFIGASPLVLAVKHTMEEPPSLSQLNPTILPEVDAVVRKALAKLPEERYTSAGELARALRTATPSNAQSTHVSPHDRVVKHSVTRQLEDQDTRLESHDAESYNDTPTKFSPPVEPPQQINRFRAGTSPHQPSQRSDGSQFFKLLLLAVLLILLIIAGSLTAYLVYQKGIQHPNVTVPKITATSQKAPTPLPDAAVSAGQRLYGTALPGPSCDTHGGLWSKTPNAHVVCNQASTNLTNTGGSPLAGIFLDQFSNKMPIPNNYVIQVQATMNPTSQGAFGIFFRNQPGNQQSTFVFLINSTNTWEIDTYNHTTGVSGTIFRGSLQAQLDSTLTIDVVVQDNTFTFYINGTNQGNATSLQNPSGNIGLTADVGANVSFKNLALYTLP